MSTARHTTAKDINSAFRAKQALQLRLEGKTLQEIADTCGFQDRSGAWRSIKRELDRVPLHDADTLRAEGVMRLEALWMAYYPKAINGNLGAAHLCLRVEESRRKLLGLDREPTFEPVKTVIREVPAGYLSLEPASSNGAKPFTQELTTT